MNSSIFNRTKQLYVCINMFIICLLLLSCTQHIIHDSHNSISNQKSADLNNMPYGPKTKLIAEGTISAPESACYDGIIYSDSDNQLILWERKKNVYIYDIINDKLILKTQDTYIENNDIYWHPKGVNSSISGKSSWFSHLSLDSLIRSEYNAPKDFKQLNIFLNKCRHIDTYSSSIVTQCCKKIPDYDHYASIDALAYDSKHRLIPIIPFYNDPHRKNELGIGISSTFLGESLYMDTLAYLCEYFPKNSEKYWQKIIFYRHLKHWREYYLRDLCMHDYKYQIASFNLSPQGNNACIVLYKFPSYGRHIGSYEWFKSFFQSQCRYVIIVVLDMQNNNILLREEISGYFGFLNKLLWRVAFAHNKKEFILLNANTGVYRIYRY